MILLLFSLLSAPFSFGAEALTAAQINRRISDAFAEVEKARFGESRAGELDPKHIHGGTVPVVNHYKKKSAQACGPLGGDLKERLGELRTQGGLGWCFALVAADVLGLEAGRRLSHFDLGLQYFRADPQSRKVGQLGERLGDDPSVIQLWSGVIEQAIQVGVRGGLCTEEEVASTDTMANLIFRPEFRIDPKDLVGIGEARANITVLHALEKSVGRSLDQLSEHGGETCASITAAQTLVPRLSTWEIISTLGSARSKQEAFHWLLNQGCRRRPIPLHEDWEYVTAYPTRKKNSSAAGELLPGVDELLKKGKPALLAFDAKKFHAGAAADPARKTAPHAALIVKREFRNGQCKYLVRDSKGPTCAGFAPPYNSPENCERGHYWITEDDFGKSVLSIGGMLK